MASVNRVTLIGNLGANPDARFMPSGDAVTNISLATNERWTGKDGTPQERVEWHRVVLFNRLAEIASEYLVKGSPVYIEGHLRTRQWQDKTGTDRWTTEIVADRMQLLNSRTQATPPVGDKPAKTTTKPKSAAKEKPAKKTDPEQQNFSDNDIPF